MNQYFKWSSVSRSKEKSTKIWATVKQAASGFLDDCVVLKLELEVYYSINLIEHMHVLVFFA